MQIVPDEPGEVIEKPAGDPAAVEPAAEAPEPAAEIEEPAPAAPEPAAPEPARKPAPSMVPLRVMQSRIGEEANKRQLAERRAADLEAILERIQKGEAPAAAAAAAPTTRSPAEGDPAFEAAVETVVTQREAKSRINDLVRTARAEYPNDWGEKADILGAVGAADPEFVLDVIAADPKNAHKILYKLAQEPERAAELASMDMRSRTAELTRMSMAEQAKPAAAPAPVVADPAPKPALSRAPAPAPRVAPHAPGPEVDPTTPEGNEKMSDAAFETWYKAKYMKRA